ncbi:glycosyltransferase [Nonomuraea sp. NPDC049625]|uniref:glycosyltransferase family protein n=1 Tax=Nonomuraea sp. NPDC049625 TaxID=3155775 RepID=UPI0034489CDC
MDTIASFCLWPFWNGGESRRPYNLLIEDLMRGHRVIYVWSGEGGLDYRDIDIDKTIAHIHAANPETAALYKRLEVVHLNSEDGSLRQVFPEPSAAIDLAISELRPAYARVHTPVTAFLPLLRALRDQGTKVVYDRMDAWAEFPALPGWHTGDIEIERAFTTVANGLTVVTPELARDLRTADLPTRTIPNAISRPFLRALLATPKPRPSDPPMVLYSGLMNPSFFDWDICYNVIKSCPEFNFVLVGKRGFWHDHELGLQVQEQEARLRTLPNSTLVEWVPHQELPKFIRQASAAIIPFAEGPVTSGVIPLKVFEYIAAGIPVVSSSLPAIADYPLVYAVATWQEMSERLREALAAPPTPTALREAELFVEANTWRERAQAMEDFAHAL